MIKALLQIKKKLNARRGSSALDTKLALIDQFLLKNENATDEDLCLFLYGHNRKTSTFRSLKHRYEEQLMNDVFELSSVVEHESNYSYRSIIASKNYTIALTLHKLGFTEDAIGLFNKNLNYCYKYSITNIALLNIKHLYYYYAFVNPNVLKMNKLLKENTALMKTFEDEKFMEHSNAIISNMYVMNKGGLNKNQLVIIGEIIEKIIAIKTTSNSRNIDLLYYDLMCFYYMLIGDYHQCNIIAREGLKITEGKHQSDQLFRYMCYINLALSNFHLENYLVSEKWFAKAIVLMPKGSRKWFHESSRYFVVLIRMKAYDKLVPLYLDVIQYKTIKKYEFIYENWLIIEAIIHFLIDLGKIKLLKSEMAKLPKFSVNKFMNSVPFFSKDKKGQFITIHVIQILFMLQKSKYDQILNSSDCLNQYTFKYLRNDETLRSNCFIKMILKLINTGFHPVRTKAHVKSLYTRLTSAKVVMDDRSSEVEIIPYEDLWEYIMEIVSNTSKHS